jgi:hypothetical protein
MITARIVTPITSRAIASHIAPLPREVRLLLKLRREGFVE